MDRNRGKLRETPNHCLPPTRSEDTICASIPLHSKIESAIAGLQRNRFGRRSDRLDDAALQQKAEDLEQSLTHQK